MKLSRRTNAIILYVLAIALLLSMVAAFTPAFQTIFSGGSSNTSYETTVVKVGDGKVTDSDVLRGRQNSFYSSVVGGEVGDDLSTLLTDELINNELIRQASSKIRVTNGEVRDAVTEFRENNGVAGRANDNRYISLLSQNGYSDETFRDFLKERTRNEKYIETITDGATVTDAQVATYFKNHRTSYVSDPQIVARQIVLDDSELAERLRVRTLAGEDFATLASEFSLEGAEKAGALGGDEPAPIGRFALPSTVADAAFSLGRSGVTNTVNSAGQYYLVNVEEFIPAGLAELDTVQEQVREDAQSALESKFIDDALEKLRANTEIVHAADSGYPFDDSVVATVDGEEITNTQWLRATYLNADVAQLLNPQNSNLIPLFYKPNILNQLIDGELAYKGAQELGIESIGGKAEQAVSALNSVVSDAENQITDEDLQSYYDSNLNLFTIQSQAVADRIEFSDQDAALSFRNEVLAGNLDLENLQTTVEDLGGNYRSLGAVAANNNALTPAIDSLLFATDGFDAIENSPSLEISDVIVVEPEVSPIAAAEANLANAFETSPLADGSVPEVATDAVVTEAEDVPSNAYVLVLANRSAEQVLGLEAVKPQIREAVLNQKRTELRTEWLNGLREKSEITNNVEEAAAEAAAEAEAAAAAEAEATAAEIAATTTDPVEGTVDAATDTGNIVDAAGNAAAGAIGTATNAISNTASGAVDAAANAGNAISNAASGAVDAAGNAAANAGEAVSNAASSTVDAAGNAAANAGNAISNAASGAVDAAGNVASNAGEAAGNAVSNVTSTVTNVTSGAVDAAGNAAANAGEAVSNAASSTVDAAGNAVSNVTNTVTNVTSGAVDAAGSAAANAGNAISNAASGAVDAAGNAAANAGEAVSNAASSTVDTAGNAVSNVTSTVTNVTSGAVDAAGSAAANAGNAISNAASGAVDAAGNVASNAGEAVSNVTSTVTNVTSGAVDAAGNAAANAGEAAGNAVSNVTTTVTNVTSGAVDAAGNAAANAGEAVSNAASSTVDAAGNAVSNVTSTVTNVTSGAVDAAGSAAANAGNVISNATSGTVDAVSGVTSTVTNTVSNAASNASNAASNASNAAGNAVSNVTTTVSNATNNVVDAASNTTSNLTNSVSSAFSFDVNERLSNASQEDAQSFAADLSSQLRDLRGSYSRGEISLEEYNAGQTQFQLVQQRIASLRGAKGTYTVQEGDTLSAIADAEYGNGALYPEIMAANDFFIDNPDRIFPGLELIIPNIEQDNGEGDSESNESMESSATTVNADGSTTTITTTNVVTNAGAAASNAASNAVTTVTETTGNVAANAGATAGNAVSNVTNTVTNVTSGAVNAAGNAAANAGATAGNAVSNVTTTVTNVTSGAADAVGSAVTNAGTAASNTASNVVTTVTETVSGTASNAANAVSNAGSNVVTNAANVVSSTGDSMTTTSETVSGTTTTTVTNVVTTTNTITGGTSIDSQLSGASLEQVQSLALDLSGQLRTLRNGVSNGTVSAADYATAQAQFQRVQQIAAAQAGAQGTYTVQEGDTLSSIANSQYGNGALFPQIMSANSYFIDNPDMIFPGLELIIPTVE